MFVIFVSELSCLTQLFLFSRFVISCIRILCKSVTDVYSYFAIWQGEKYVLTHFLIFLSLIIKNTNLQRLEKRNSLEEPLCHAKKVGRGWHAA